VRKQQDISAIVCTRNRGASVVATIQSILVNTHSRFEVIVIDQSTDNTTERAVAPLCIDSRLRYIRSATKGLGRARNIGLHHAQSEIVAFTDDDCTVPLNWLQVMEEVFERNPRVSVAFCNVEVAPHNNTTGFIPGYVRSESKLVCTFWDKCRSRGIGAGMAVRKPQILAIGGFDEELGAGGLFPSCEDGDIALRALSRSQWVYETHEVAVIHYGFRTWEEGKELAQRDWVGVGAAYIKLLKAGEMRVILVLLYELLVHCVGESLLPLLHLRRPRGLLRALYLFKGCLLGLQRPINRLHLTFSSEVS
jgi:GT2 family glycosyltransferase